MSNEIKPIKKIEPITPDAPKQPQESPQTPDKDKSDFEKELEKKEKQDAKNRDQVSMMVRSKRRELASKVHETVRQLRNTMLELEDWDPELDSARMDVAIRAANDYACFLKLEYAPGDRI